MSNGICHMCYLKKVQEIKATAYILALVAAFIIGLSIGSLYIKL
jgi:hypothetical protein